MLDQKKITDKNFSNENRKHSLYTIGKSQWTLRSRTKIDFFFEKKTTIWEIQT